MSDNRQAWNNDLCRRLLLGSMDNTVRLWDATKAFDDLETDDFTAATGHIHLQDNSQELLLGTYTSKSTPVVHLHFTRRNLLLASGAYNPWVTIEWEKFIFPNKTPYPQDPHVAKAVFDAMSHGQKLLATLTGPLDVSIPQKCHSWLRTLFVLACFCKKCLTCKNLLCLWLICCIIVFYNIVSCK